MKNLIDPQIIATYKKNPPTTEEIVKFLDSNRKISTAKFCKLIGISPQKVYDYRYRKQSEKSSKDSPLSSVIPKAASKSFNRYSAEDKYILISEYNKADDKGKAELLRRYGIYQTDIDRWEEKIKQASLEALGKRKTRSDKKSPEQLKIEELEKELNEQRTTSAKLSTLLVLQKKTFDMLSKND